jgi:hypothetical protein
MEDDIKTVSLHALEDFAASSAFGQAGLHSVSERPLMRDRRKQVASTRKGRPAVTLRRHSLMNERTRIRRPSEFSGEKRTHRRHSSMRKRKSDELGSIDLSDLDSSDYAIPEFDKSRLSLAKHPLDNFGGSFYGVNSSWFPEEKYNPDDEEDEILVQRRSKPSSIFASPKDVIETPQATQDDDAKIIPDIRVTSKTSPAPETPLFRHYRHQSSSSHEGDSPCSVAALTRGCGVCFWERSLAWSEDEDDDDDDGILHPSLTQKAQNIQDHLSVPQHLGKDFAKKPEVTRSINRPAHFRRPSSSRVVTLERDSRHKLRGSKMFRQTDVDQVTEIHWEEKVLDTTALEMMAKLSL